MKKTHWILIDSWATGGLMALGFFAMWPNALWWAYPLVALIVGGVVYEELIKTSARQTIIDGIKPEPAGTSGGAGSR